ncbi:MAG: acetate kinase, partial [Pedobacter sp.]
MKVFVINSGSSSIKYQLIDMPAGQVICSGLAEKIGLANAEITHKVFTENTENVCSFVIPLPDHETAMQEIEKLLIAPHTGVIRDPAEIEIVGHRVVHGGETFSSTTLITEAVKEEIKRLFPLAPLHNPGHYAGIGVAKKLFPAARQIAVFDTAFHQTMPEKAFRYAIPEKYYRQEGIRAYGFHGISHQYVSRKAAEYLQNPDAKIISIHLGNGCSIAAILGGKCMDTSMGFTPLDGLIMGSRSGAIDASVLIYLMDKSGLSAQKLSLMLNKESGMAGLTGHSDMRDVTRGYQEGDQKAILALEMYAYRVQKYLGAYAAVLNGIDAIVFTAGVGENDQLTRKLICQNMNFLGIRLDEKKNKVNTGGIR